MATTVIKTTFVQEGASQLASQLDKLKAKVADLDKRSGAVGKLAQSGAGSAVLGAITRVTGVAAVVAGLGKLATGFADAREQLETYSRVFDSSFGEGKGQAIYGALRRMATDTGVGFAELAESATQLGASGLPKIEKALRTIADASSATLDKAGTFKLLSEMVAKGQVGKFETGSLDQLTQRGIPALTLLTEKLGKSRQAISEMAQTSQGSRLLIQALLESLGEKYAGEAARSLDTISGKWTILKNKLAEGLGEGAIAEGISTALKYALDRMIQFVSWIDTLPTRVANSFNRVGYLLTVVWQEAGNDTNSFLGRFVDSFNQAIRLIGSNWKIINEYFRTDVAIPIAQTWDALLKGMKDGLTAFGAANKALYDTFPDWLKKYGPWALFREPPKNNVGSLASRIGQRLQDEVGEADRFKREEDRLKKYNNTDFTPNKRGSFLPDAGKAAQDNPVEKERRAYEGLRKELEAAISLDQKRFDMVKAEAAAIELVKAAKKAGFTEDLAATTQLLYMKEQVNEKLRKQTELLQHQKDLNRTFSEGAQSAVRDIERQTSAYESGRQAVQFVENGIHSMVDALFEGNFTMENFFKNLLKQIAHTITQLLIVKPLVQALFGNGMANNSGGDIGGLLGKGISYVGGLIGLSSGGMVPSYASGGSIPQMSSGGMRDRVPAMLEPGEFVMRKHAVSGIGLPALQRMNAGFGAAPKVQINNKNEGTPKNMEQQGDMRFDGEKFIIDTISRDIENNGTIRRQIRGMR